MECLNEERSGANLEKSSHPTCKNSDDADCEIQETKEVHDIENDDAPSFDDDSDGIASPSPRDRRFSAFSIMDQNENRELQSRKSEINQKKIKELTNIKKRSFSLNENIRNCRDVIPVQRVKSVSPDTMSLKGEETPRIGDEENLKQSEESLRILRKRNKLSNEIKNIQEHQKDGKIPAWKLILQIGKNSVEGTLESKTKKKASPTMKNKVNTTKKQNRRDIPKEGSAGTSDDDSDENIDEESSEDECEENEEEDENKTGQLGRGDNNSPQPAITDTPLNGWNISEEIKKMKEREISKNSKFISAPEEQLRDQLNHLMLIQESLPKADTKTTSVGHYQKLYQQFMKQHEAHHQRIELIEKQTQINKKLQSEIDEEDPDQTRISSAASISSVDFSDSLPSLREDQDSDTKKQVKVPLTVSMWITKMKNRVINNRYKEMHEKIAKYLEEKKIVTQLKEKDPIPAYWEQGNLEMYSTENIKKRLSIRREDVILQALRKWWDKTVKIKGKPEVINNSTYISLAMAIYTVLMPRDSRKTLEDARKTAEKDWERDSKGNPYMDFDGFFNAMFELADIWCETTEIAEYVSFLRTLYQKVYEDPTLPKVISKHIIKRKKKQKKKKKQKTRAKVIFISERLYPSPKKKLPKEHNILDGEQGRKIPSRNDTESQTDFTSELVNMAVNIKQKNKSVNVTNFDETNFPFPPQENSQDLSSKKKKMKTQTIEEMYIEIEKERKAKLLMKKLLDFMDQGESFALERTILNRLTLNVNAGRNVSIPLDVLRLIEEGAISPYQQEYIHRFKLIDLQKLIESLKILINVMSQKSSDQQKSSKTNHNDGKDDRDMRMHLKPRYRKSMDHVQNGNIWPNRIRCGLFSANDPAIFEAIEKRIDTHPAYSSRIGTKTSLRSSEVLKENFQENGICQWKQVVELVRVILQITKEKNLRNNPTDSLISRNARQLKTIETQFKEFEEFIQNPNLDQDHPSKSCAYTEEHPQTSTLGNIRTDSRYILDKLRKSKIVNEGEYFFSGASSPNSHISEVSNSSALSSWWYDEYRTEKDNAVAQECEKTQNRSWGALNEEFLTFSVSGEINESDPKTLFHRSQAQNEKGLARSDSHVKEVSKNRIPTPNYTDQHEKDPSIFRKQFGYQVYPEKMKNIYFSGNILTEVASHEKRRSWIPDNPRVEISHRYDECNGLPRLTQRQNSITELQKTCHNGERENNNISRTPHTPDFMYSHPPPSAELNSPDFFLHKERRYVQKIEPKSSEIIENMDREYHFGKSIQRQCLGDHNSGGKSLVHLNSSLKGERKITSAKLSIRTSGITSVSRLSRGICQTERVLTRSNIE